MKNSEMIKKAVKFCQNVLKPFKGSWLVESRSQKSVEDRQKKPKAVEVRQFIAIEGS